MRSFDKTQSAAADERGAKASFFYIEVCRGSGIVKSRRWLSRLLIHAFDAHGASDRFDCNCRRRRVR